MPRWFLPTTAALCALLGLANARLASAQSPGTAAVTSTGELRGRLIEAGTGRPIGGGSVTVRRAGSAGDSAFAGGALPREDGSFRVDGLAPGRYALRVRAIGYAPLVRSDLILSPAQPVVDLGALTLSVVAAKLEGQMVTAERDEVALAPDRNSYSTRNMATASGGTAVDVLRNVPSVEVDGSNNVSLRGNANVVVQINGRSSPLRGEQLGSFLAQLPAHSVSRVEVATNPSAKHDPEGTAGIINIVLNQEAELGLSGGFSASTGTTGMANLSGNLGRQKGPLTLFLSGSRYSDSRASSGTTSRANLAIPGPAFVESRATSRRADCATRSRRPRHGCGHSPPKGAPRATRSAADDHTAPYAASSRRSPPLPASTASPSSSASSSSFHGRAASQCVQTNCTSGSWYIR